MVELPKRSMCSACLPTNAYEQAVDLGAGFTRSWTYQETALAPRTVYFTTVDLVWECCQAWTPERFLFSDFDSRKPVSLELGYRNTLFGDYNLVDYGLKVEVLGGSVALGGGTLAGGGPLAGEFAIGARLVLTYDLDRLPALSGIASRFQPIFNCRYLAGLWECQLLDDLTWRVENPQITTKRRPLLAYAPSEYVAPSWSWASISQPVEHDQITLNRTRCLEWAVIHGAQGVHCQARSEPIRQGHQWQPQACLGGFIVFHELSATV
ncbi:hypothetical protein V8E51_006479 [Hyaloscypha variabilis]